MTASDESNFLRAIHDIAPYRLIRNTFPDEAKMLVDPQRVHRMSSETNLSLINQTLERRVKYDFFPSKSYFCIDLIESEVVQFHRCHSDTWLKSGRLWFAEKTVGNESKFAEFTKWANSLLKWLRANYKKDKSGNYLVGPEALALSEAGKLQLGPPSQRTLSETELRKLLGPSATKKKKIL